VDLRIDAGIDEASGMVAAAIGHVLDDPFTYELAAPPRRLPGGGLRFVVVARVAGAELVRFKLDISSRDAITGELERHPSDPILPPGSGNRDRVPHATSRTSSRPRPRHPTCTDSRHTGTTRSVPEG
jgi:hypothetical protein